ncbi:MAG: twin-arginine translocation signal domain-containing protein [Acidobacteria bacterium]|nr:twin-arginine translocation signal domain-containing protein [Acidobacteriota bacterium]
MKNEELKDKAPESPVANAAQESELANRRSFMKNLAAGTVAAGALAGTVVSAGSTKAATISAQKLGVAARRPTAVLRLSFPKQRPPKLDDVFRAIEQALRPTGCTACGFDGLDCCLRLDTIIGPDPEQFVATLEGELVQQ